MRHVILSVLVIACAALMAPAFAQAPPEPEMVAVDEGADEGVAVAPAKAIQQRIATLRQESPQRLWFERALSLVGTAGMVGIGWLLSQHKRHVYWRTIIWGVCLQLVFALIVLKTGPGRAFFAAMNTAVVTFLGFTEEGARFVFGNLVRNNVPVGEPLGGSIDGSIPPEARIAWANTGAYFAFNVLPTIIFFSSFMTILYHLGVMQWVVKAMAVIMQRSMRTSGAESLSAAANIFVGQTEAPLVVRPYVPTMTESELMAVMTGGFATVAGGVMAAYVGMLSGSFPEIAGHLIAASVMSAPASLVIAKVMLPERGTPETAGTVRMHVEKLDVNVIDAAARGAGDGLRLALNVAAMLLAFVALLAALNFGLGKLGSLVGLENLSLQRILAVLFWPIAWLMGTPLSDCGTVAMLMGEKIVLTEFVAYLHLADLLASGAPLTYRGVVIATYALCGFANFGSIAIQIGGIGGIAPGRRHDLAKLGLRAMIGGTLAANMTATIAGMLV